MVKKLLLFTKSLFLKTLFVVFLLSASNMFGQTAVDRIYTDWNGYWTSNKSTGIGNQPDTENNLLAFLWNGKTYSTGVNDAALTSHSISFKNTNFRALKIQSLGYDGTTYFLQGSNIDKDLADRKLTPPISGSISTPAELASRLTDGINGLALGTGIANIQAGTSAEFKIGTNNLQLGVFGDGTPDIVVSQVASPSSIVDTFKFVNASGVTVGNVVNVAFTSIPVVGTYRLDLFNAKTGLPASGYSANDSRDIRLLALDLASFGINDGNANDVDRFVVTFSGGSDCAFIAFNTESLKIAELSLVKKASFSGCAKVGAVINYTFDVENTGKVPVTDINVTDSMPGFVWSGSGVIGTLAAGAKATVTGSYTITAADIANGKVENSATVTGIDPSLNTVEDLSGQTKLDDISTVTLINGANAPAVGAVTNLSCTDTGSVVLNNLPSTGTWTLERTPGGVTTTGTGTSTTIIDLLPGTYTFKVSNASGCQSVSSSNVVIGGLVTVWNGSAWSDGVPNATMTAVFSAPYTATTDLAACSCIINSDVTVTVQSGKTFTITNAVINNGVEFIFENNASLIQINNVVNTGEIVYNRISTPMKNFDFTYWCSPVAGQVLNVLSPNTLWDKYQSWANGKWFTENGLNKMDPAGKGFSIRVPKPNAIYSNGENWTGLTYAQPVKFVGVPNNGDITIASLGDNKYNLIGNPYPSAIDADKFIDDNVAMIGGGLYFWTHNTAIAQSGSFYVYSSNDYAIYLKTGGIKASSGGVPPGNTIAAGQSFFVASKTTGVFKFNNAMRNTAATSASGSNSQFFRMSKTKKTAEIDKSRVWLNLTNSEGIFKQLLVGYITGATNEMDNLYDGISFNGNTYADFYSVNKTNNLAIQGRSLPFDKMDKVPLGYRTTVAGTFQISIDNVDGELTNQTVFLEDNVTKTVHNLKNRPYSFTTVKGTFNDRFTLVYVDKTAVVVNPPVTVEPPVAVGPPAVVDPPVAVEPPAVVNLPDIVNPPVVTPPVVALDLTLENISFDKKNKSVIVSTNNHQIKINSFDTIMDVVIIYDLKGRVLYKKNHVNSNEFVISNFNSSKQFLIVMTQLDSGRWVAKEIVF